MIKILLITLLLSGCASKVQEYKQVPIVPPPHPEAMQLAPVNFDVITTNNKMYITLTPQEYEHLATNIHEIRRYILQQKATIKYYDDLYKPSTDK